MTGHKGNIEFCFLGISNIEIWREQNSLFSKVPVIKLFVINYSKTKQANLEKGNKIPATTSGHPQLHALITVFLIIFLWHKFSNFTNSAIISQLLLFALYSTLTKSDHLPNLFQWIDNKLTSICIILKKFGFMCRSWVFNHHFIKKSF